MKYLLIGALFVLVLSLVFFVAGGVTASEQAAPGVVGWQEFCQGNGQLVVSVQKDGSLLYDCTSDVAGRWPLACPNTATVAPVTGRISVTCQDLIKE